MCYCSKAAYKFISRFSLFYFILTAGGGCWWFNSNSSIHFAVSLRLLEHCTMTKSVCAIEILLFRFINEKWQNLLHSTSRLVGCWCAPVMSSFANSIRYEYSIIFYILSSNPSNEWRWSFVQASNCLIGIVAHECCVSTFPVKWLRNLVISDNIHLWLQHIGHFVACLLSLKMCRGV